jgi:serine protease Do
MRCALRLRKCGSCGGLSLLLLVAVTASRVAAQERTADADQQAVQYVESLSRAFRQAAKKVLPTVVTIKTSARAQVRSRDRSLDEDMNPFEDSPLDEFFGDRRRPQTTPRREGLGSGVIIDPKGIVLTNNHVVEGMDSVVVELSDGRELAATDIKTDPSSDIAVLHIRDAAPFPAATLGDSDQLQIGDWVLAVGSPFGLDDTVSAGIISAKGRSLQAVQRTQFLQTDAAINPGNSGGPLINMRGEVVGINAVIATDSGSFQGVGFAIPVNLVKWVANQLIRDGRVQRSYLGVGVVMLTAELVEQFGGTVGQGVFVEHIYPNSPAQKAGLQFGDIITTFQQAPIRTPGELQQAVEKLAVGTPVAVAVLRDGKTEAVTVTLEDLPATALADARTPGRSLAPRRAPPATALEKAMGLEVQDLAADVARQLGYAERTSGVLIVAVDANGLAAAEGITRGMLILKVRKTEVLTVEQFRKALESESLDRGVPVLIGTPTEDRLVVIKRE